MFDFTTKDNPRISNGVTATVRVIDGTVALTFFRQLVPRIEYPLRSSLLMDQSYSSIATGIKFYKLSSASIYKTIFLFFRVNCELVPLVTFVTYL